MSPVNTTSPPLKRDGNHTFRLRARTLSLAVTAALLPALSGAALAQSQQATELDRVTVTGSRIQTSQTVTASAPVAEISAEEFKFSGTTRVEDLLNQYPQMSAGMDSFTVNPSPGFPSANLRGLGPERTLVLVNGQRLPPGGVRSEARDLNQIPSALVKRVDVLTGGASAVYGADAVAGVVNFILDTDFEGISANIGYSGYQHNNNNKYMRELMGARNFDYPSGSTGLDGIARNFDIAFGGKFAEGRGHAMGWVTWRENRELRQGARDYSSCSLGANGTACGGSGTSPEPNFIITRGLTDLNGNRLYNFDSTTGDFVRDDDGNPVQRAIGSNYHVNADNTWGTGAPSPYNFAPINHYQRPDKRITFGSSIKFEVNEHFKPYLNTMFANTNTRVQIAESGTFFSHEAITMDCNNPLLRSFCTDTALQQPLNVTGVAIMDANGNPVTAPQFDANFDPTGMEILVGKRNVEGGPRISELDSNNLHLVGGVEGAINDFWSYNVSAVYGRNSSTEININDFVTDRIVPALLGCPAGSYLGCVPYDVWNYNNITAADAADLAGVGMRKSTSVMQVYSGYVTGAFDWGLPSARGESIGLVLGVEHRRESYNVRSDSNMAAGNFAGLGGPRPPISGQIDVDELFLESQIPLFMSESGSHNLFLDLGYRYSDYSTSGNVNTYKIGFAGTIADNYRLRGGFNRAIRAPNISELFTEQSIGLFTDNGDPCAPDAAGNVRFTPEQCARTGVTAAQYGNDLIRSPADQYNHFTGGNQNLKPEEADTWTLGFVATPIANLSLAVDFYDIKIKEQIGEIGAGTILEYCGLTGDNFLCSKIHRNPTTGDLWVGSNINNSGYVENLTDNFGEVHFQGIDLSANYGWGMWKGWMSASFTGTHVRKAEWSPLPGVNDDATYNCAGIINGACGGRSERPATPDWKHVVNLRYSADAYSVGVRWRHIGALDYKNQDGSNATLDQILVRNGNKMSAMNYLDLSGSYSLTDNIELSGGVNNIVDKTPPLVGNSLSLNANSIAGYDQLGRFFFANLNIRF